MDPNSNLVAQLRLAREIIKLSDNAPDEPVEKDDELRRLQQVEDKANQLAELVQSLDQWIRRGGLLPYPWAKKR